LSTILLLEDEPVVMTLMVRVLMPLGHTLLRATNREEAFQRFEEADGSIDLLIADVNLPAISGIRVAVELHSLLPNLRIIFTSGHTPDLWKDAAELEEVPSESVAVLQKPFLPATLRKAVSRFAAVASEPGLALPMAAPSRR
jgi:two-component system cell cycle sensor histidine kinase/response regulator CckA